MLRRIAWPAAASFLLCGIHLWIYATLPEARKERGWPAIVMRNWHDYGLSQVGCQLLANPGGLDPGETPFIYPRHQPYFLLLPYGLKEICPATGDGQWRAAV